jgi:hypothetical protein
VAPYCAMISSQIPVIHQLLLAQREQLRLREAAQWGQRRQRPRCHIDESLSRAAGPWALESALAAKDHPLDRKL